MFQVFHGSVYLGAHSPYIYPTYTLHLPYKHPTSRSRDVPFIVPETRLPLKPLDHEVCVIAGTRRRYVDGRASIHVLVERDVRIATSVLGTLFLGLNIHEWFCSSWMKYKVHIYEGIHTTYTTWYTSFDTHHM